MLNGKIDLRSDTITPPDEGMRQAMANAIVGDDVLGDDPTVQALENHVAELMGKQKALYVPSGTMANQLAIRTQTRPGDAMILGSWRHQVESVCVWPIDWPWCPKGHRVLFASP